MALVPPRYEPTGGVLPGGMGSVVICNDKVLERLVAIKFIHGTTHRRRMLDELAGLLKMRSKHVVQVYDLLKLDGGKLGIVQEFIDGKDLFDGHKIPSSPTDFYKLLWQIVCGISDIHAAGVIHRDIKPNNMKTDPEGIIKIFDFGLARDEGPKAATVGFVGTQGFAAPELYAAAARFTNAIDTYAFGATALFLATGNLPIELRVQPPNPSPAGYFAGVGLPLAHEVIAILDACLASAPTTRPALSSVRDLLAKHLLFDKHQALVVYAGKAKYLNSADRVVALNFGTIGQVEITYDGLEFRVTQSSGEVFINNRMVTANDVLPGACVVSLGGSHRLPRSRAYITFDLSHPEILL